MTIDPAITAICAEFGVRVVARHEHPGLGDTRSGGTLGRIYRSYGPEHLRLVLATLTETGNNKICLDEFALRATSDLIRTYAGILEHDASAWLQAWDQIPVAELQFIAQDLRGFVPQRSALAGMIHERLHRRFGPEQFDMFRGVM